MAVCAYHPINIKTSCIEKDEENEKLYFEAIKAYDKEELNAFPKALAHLTRQAYKDPYSDILGDFFTIHVTRGENGQYFTPDPICTFMASIVGGDENEVRHQRILDPACGSGRMLLAFAKRNHQNYFYGNDISDSCAKMTAVNFFLNGLKGEVAQINSLSMEFYKAWRINMDGIGILPIDKEQSQIYNTPFPNKDNAPLEEGQLSLF